MPLTGHRYAVERQKLCAWLEDERKKIAYLGESERAAGEVRLEADFRRRLDALYAEAKPELEPPRGN